MKAAIYFILLVALSIAAAAQSLPIGYFGLVTIDGTNATNSTTVEALYLNGSSILSTTTPTIPEQPDNSYKLNVVLPDNTSFVLAVWGIEASNQTWTAAQSSQNIQVDLNVTRLANGQSCTYNEACASGKCCSGTCKTTCTTSIQTLGGGGGGGGGYFVPEEEEEPEPTEPLTPNFNIQPQEEEPQQQDNRAPTFGEQTAPAPTEPQPEEQGLTPQATGLFKIGNRDITVPQVVVVVIFISAVGLAGFYGYLAKLKGLLKFFIK